MPDLLPISGVDDDGFLPITPAGPLSVAIDALRTLIANVPFFQTWTATADATHALLRVFTGDVGYPILSASIAANVLTIATREPHGIQTGQVCTIEGAALGPESELSIDGPQTVLATSETTLTISVTLPDLAIVYPDQAFVMPSVRPITVIAESSESVHSQVIGTGGAAIYAGGIDILIEADVSVAHQHNARNALLEARNAFGQFQQGLAETQGTGDLMCLNRIEPVSGPEFTQKPEQDDNYPRFERWRALLRVTWGLES